MVRLSTRSQCNMVHFIITSNEAALKRLVTGEQSHVDDQMWWRVVQGVSGRWTMREARMVGQVGLLVQDTLYN